MKHTIFGESHGPAIGVVLEGVPHGLHLDMVRIARDMARRAPGGSPLTTARREADTVRIVSGLFEGVTTGSPLCAYIENTDTRSADYTQLRRLPRPGHADYTGSVRYGGFQDLRGGGHFSGRLTAPLVFAGAVAKHILAERGIMVLARIRDIAGIYDRAENFVDPDCAAWIAAADQPLAVLDAAQGQKMHEAILAASRDGDSVGGSIEALVLGLPAGCGGPDYNDTLEGLIARQIFAIPAIKGLEFGSGFGIGTLRGSQANDSLYYDAHEKVCTRTNHNGGINGGISNGMPLVFAVAVKPTPSIACEQQTIDLLTRQAASLRVHGRHDPCIVPRAVPVVEAATALALCEALGI